jgi:hypothetical protein
MQLVEVKSRKWWKILEILGAIKWLNKLCDVWGDVKIVGMSLDMLFKEEYLQFWELWSWELFYGIWCILGIYVDDQNVL